MAATQDFYKDINDILNDLIQLRDRQRMLDDIEAEDRISQAARDEMQSDIDSRLEDAKQRAQHIDRTARRSE